MFFFLVVQILQKFIGEMKSGMPIFFPAVFA